MSFIFFKNRKILVTGAGGFIGSHLVEVLYKLNCQKIRAFIHYNSQNRWGNLELLPDPMKKEIEIILGDLRDPSSVKEAVKGMDIVFHLGALISIPYSYIAPQSFFETNVFGTLNVMRASLEENVEKVIHTSTSEVYGTALYVPIDESHPLQAQSPYSASKIGADKAAESFHRTYDLPVAIIRPFNTFGPRQSPRAIVPTILIQVLRKDAKKIRLGSLHPVRDMNYVGDIVDGFLDVARSRKSTGEVINIGSGRGISIKELTKKIIKLSKAKVKIEIEKERIRPEKSEVNRLFCDNRKAKELLNWKPKISLEEGLKWTIDYYEKSLEKYRSKIYHI